MQVEALAVKLTQKEGELIQEKFEVKKLASFLKQVLYAFLNLLLYFLENDFYKDLLIILKNTSIMETRASSNSTMKHSDANVSHENLDATQNIL